MNDREKEFFAKAAKVTAPPDLAKALSRKRLFKVLAIVFIGIPLGLLLLAIGIDVAASKLAVDPLMVLGLIVGLPVLILLLFQGKGKASWRDDPATQKQLDYLEDLGGDISGHLTKGEASDRITELTGE